MRPCVRPFLGAHGPWPVWDPRVRIKTSDRARSSPCDTDFPSPDPFDRCHTSFSFCRTFEVGLLVPPQCNQKRSPSKTRHLRDHGHSSGHLVQRCKLPPAFSASGEDTPSQEFFASGRALAPEITAIAPMISRRGCRAGGLARAPEPLLAAVECCLDTSPTRPGSHGLDGNSPSRGKAASAIEMTATPGIVCRRAENRERRLAAAISASSFRDAPGRSSIWASRSAPCDERRQGDPWLPRPAPRPTAAGRHSLALCQ